MDNTIPNSISSSGAPTSRGKSGFTFDGGVVAGVSAFAIWGVGLIYIKWLQHVPAFEITAQRVIWALLFVIGWLFIIRKWGAVATAFRSVQELKVLSIAAIFCGFNWLFSAVAVLNGYVVELSFGYFVAPIMIVITGAALLRERMNILQATAVGLAAIAAAVQGVAIGNVPWFSLAVGLNWTCYSYVRKKCTTPAVPGFFVECFLLAIPALAYVYFIETNQQGHFLADSYTTALLIGSFSVTAVPLICFTAANKKLRLVTMGILQYIAPSLQFLSAVAIFQEPASAAKLVTFPIIWVALTIFAWDAVRRERWQRVSSSHLCVATREQTHISVATDPSFVPAPPA